MSNIMMPHRSFPMEGEETLQLFGLWCRDPQAPNVEKLHNAKSLERCSTDKQKSRK